MKMRSITSSVIVLLFSIPALAQWNTNGSRIYYNSGNVGVGTSSPTEKLDVNGMARADSFKGDYAKFGSHAYISGHSDGFVNLAVDAKYVNGDWAYTGNGSVFQLDNQGAFRFYEQNSSIPNRFDLRMILDASGNLGVGVGSPTEKLDVSGTVKATSFLGSGALLTDLNAANISMGTLHADRIPDLAASNINSGIFSTARIPDLSASKITSGELPYSRVQYGSYMISTAGSDGQVWTSDGSGKGRWEYPETGSWSQSGSSIYYNSGNVGIGTAFPTEKLHINGAARADSFKSVYAKYGDHAYVSGQNQGFAILSTNAWNDGTPVTGWNFPGSQPGSIFQTDALGKFYFIKHEGNDNTFDTRMILDENGHLGIGTSTPSSRLEVKGGDIKLKSVSPTNSNDIGDLIFQKDNGVQYGRIWTSNSSSGSLYLSSEDNTADIAIDRYGRVGIGTVSPTEKLHVAGTVKATSFQGDGSSLTGFTASQIPNGNYMIDNPGTSGQVWTSNGVGKGHWAAISSGGSNDNLGNHTATENIQLNGHWLSNDGGDEGLRIDNTGNIGIGIANPVEKLHINGAAQADSFKGLYAKYGNHAYVSSQHQGFAILSNNAWNTGSGWNYLGNGSIFELDTLGNFWFFKHDKTGNPNLRMRLHANGNLGIGVSTPTEKLHVAGTVKAVDFDGDGSKLTGLTASQIPNGQYMIDSEGESGQVWASDGDGEGHWTDLPDGNGNGEFTQYGTAAYLSGHHSGDFAHLATNAWHAGGAWNFRESKPGILFQLNDLGKFKFFKHDGNGGFDLKMILDEEGALGIGVPNPTEKLEVAGTAKADNFKGEYAQYGDYDYVSGQNQGFAILSTNAWNDGTPGTGWHFPDNKRGSIFQTDTLGNFYFITHGGAPGTFDTQMILDANGNLGIGTSAPAEKLDVDGGIRIGNTSTTQAGAIRWTGTDFEGYDGTAWASFTSGGTSNSPWNTAGDTISFSGARVGIGTATPQHELDVSGTIRACEVEVNNLDGWCDYVFEADYNLPSLKEVKSYINTNKHLQDIPSEAEVMANGVSLNDMTKGLLKKVEELTLYMIEKDEQVEALLKRIEELEKN